MPSDRRPTAGDSAAASSVDREDTFARYVAARRDQLRRAAYQLVGDWSAADDLVQVTLTKVYLAWSRIDVPEPFVRRTMVNAFLDERRRPWNRETVHAAVPERAVAPVSVEVVDALLAALERLPPRQRATVLLRHWYSLSVEETAAELGCSPGTVKSQSARALAALRLALAEPADSGAQPTDRQSHARTRLRSEVGSARTSAIPASGSDPGRPPAGRPRDVDSVHTCPSSSRTSRSPSGTSRPRSRSSPTSG